MILAKQANESRIYKIHFQNRLDELGTGYYLTGTPTVIPDPGITITNATLEGTKQVKFNASGGVSGTTYSIAISVTATDGAAIQTLEATILLRVQDDPFSTTIPYKPPSWKLEAGHRRLKGIVNSLAPIGDEEKGLTQDDFNAAENYAWRVLITHLVGHYDISGWSNDPPYPLFEIWDLLASSYIATIVGQEMNVENEHGLSTANAFLQEAKNMVRSLIDPEFEGLRLNLIRTNGTIQHKRSKVTLPKVASTSGVVFFPSNKETKTAWGDSIEGSVEDFVENYCVKVL